MQFMKIPKERIAVLIGHEGEVKLQVQERTGVRISVASKSGDVNLDESKAKDPLLALKVRDFVRAVGLGFSPERALMLLDEDAYFYVLDIKDYAGRDPKDIKRLKGRLIGTGGKTRRIIEELSEAELSIYEHYVAIVGDLESSGIARTAVDMLLSGSEHSSVYSFLERRRREQKIARMGMDYIVRR